jgi:hypothetical protein
MKLSENVREMAASAGSVKQRYAPLDPRPLGGYLTAMATYGGGAGALLLAASRRSGFHRISAGDLALITVATHRLSRTLAKDAVTSPLRAPVTRYRETGLPSEVNEEVAPRAKRSDHAHVFAELITCPFCLGQWVATGLVAGQVLAPRLTRLLTTTFTAVAGADALQFVYSALQRLDSDERG